MTVVDKHGRPRCNILQVAVFETTFGAPDPRLVQGEGYATAEEFKRVHRHVWDDLLDEIGVQLGDETVLIVELFRLLEQSTDGA